MKGKAFAHRHGTIATAAVLAGLLTVAPQLAWAEGETGDGGAEPQATVSETAGGG